MRDDQRPNSIEELDPVDPEPLAASSAPSGGSGPTDRPWDGLRTSVRKHPREWALGALVAVAAVITGIGFGALASRNDGVGAGSPSPSPSPSALVSSAPSVSAGTSASASPAPSASHSPASTASESAGASESSEPSAVASATARATEPPVVDESEAPHYGITGMWEQMPVLPDADDYLLSDALLVGPSGAIVSQGQLVVIRWGSNPGPDGPQVVAWDPASERWRIVETEDFVAGSDASFALGSDGQLHGFASTIDTTDEPWMTTGDGVATPDEIYAGHTLDAGPDGRIYRPPTDGGNSARMLIFDPKSDETIESTALNVPSPWCVLGGPDEVFAMTATDIMTYFPAEDAWKPIVDATPGQIDCQRAGIGPDGRIYALAETDEGPQIMAWRPGAHGWAAVEPPPSRPGFRPIFLAGPGGDTLWAIGEDEVWRFEPDPS